MSHIQVYNYYQNVNHISIGDTDNSTMGVAVDNKRNKSVASDAADEMLLVAIAAGNDKALDTLYRRYSVLVYRYLMRLTGDEQLADELVTDVFLQVWRRAHAFGGRSQVSTWILAIARFMALSTYRQRRQCSNRERAYEAERAKEQDIIQNSIEDVPNNPECFLIKEGVRTQIRSFLKHLSDKHREIIDLLYYQEKTVDEAAAITSTSTNTVKTRAFYARRHLARLVSESGLSLGFSHAVVL